MRARRLTTSPVTTRSRSEKKDLGRRLRDRGWAEEGQLRLALERQRRSGGALSTALLELEAVSESRLLDALAELHGLPPAGATELDEIPPTVIALVSPREASRYRVVPFAAVGGRADVATDRPGAIEELDELSFLLGRRLAVHVTTEVRLVEALERWYGIARPSRLGELVARLTAPPPGSEPPSDTPSVPDVSSRPLPGAPVWHQEESRTPIVTSRFRPRAPTVPPDPRRVISLTAEERQALSAGRGPAGSIVAARFLDEALHRLQLAATARQVGDVVLEATSGDFDWVALLRRRRDRWVGWLGTGHGLVTDRLRSCDFGDSEPSFVLELEPGDDLWTGPLTLLPAHQRLAAAWGDDLEGRFTAGGLRLRERLVGVFLGRRPAERAPNLDDEALRQLLGAAGRALQTLLAAEHRAGR